MSGVHEAFGITAAVLSFVTCPMYVLAIVRGQTKPDRVTWWVLAFVSGMIASTYHAVGARETLWLPVEYTLSFLIVAFFSIRYGDGPPRLHLLDRICVAGAIASGLIWWALNSPAIALLACIVTEFIGLFPTIVKAYARPWTENRPAWIIATVASALNVLALTSYGLTLSAYPIYVLATNIVILVFLLRPELCRFVGVAERRA
ncbi:MAG: hypothetical protein KGJ49_04945 [Alphaproteobacteria bacterium]|nr:hypothetical protein [Alphaproteobacteria bacterium]